MRKAIIFTLGIAAIALVGSVTADAAVKAYWDQATGRWMKFDTKARRVSPVSPGHGATTGMGQVQSFGGSPVPRKTIDYKGPFHAKTIVINTAERRLYFVFEEGRALKYGVGVGREGFQWAGVDRVSRKAAWPGWTPPPEMIARERRKGRILPKYMKGGPRNPLGARALYIGGTQYRIHGSNEPWTIGRAVSSGCIRLTNEDVIHLYERVKVGTRVVVLRGDESPAKLLALANPPSEKISVADARVKDDGLASIGVSVGVVVSGTVPADAAAVRTTASVTPIEDAPAPRAAIAPEARTKDETYIAAAPVALVAATDTAVTSSAGDAVASKVPLPVDDAAKDDGLTVAVRPAEDVAPDVAEVKGDAAPLEVDATDEALPSDPDAKDDAMATTPASAVGTPRSKLTDSVAVSNSSPVAR